MEVECIPSMNKIQQLNFKDPTKENDFLSSCTHKFGLTNNDGKDLDCNVF